MKVVINSCYGGFSLSDKAVLLGRKLSGDKHWAGATLVGEYFPDGSGPLTSIFKNTAHIDYDFPRNDSILVKVVETLGKKANGALADLTVVEIPDDIEWDISKYDGIETIEEKHRKWS